MYCQFPLNFRLTNKYVKALTVIESTLFAGTSDGVFWSTDNGENWTTIKNTMTSQSVSTFTVSGSMLVAGTNKGILLSTDYGSTWKTSNTDLSSKIVKALSVKGTTIFAGTDSGGVYRSTDNGENWTAVNSGLTNQKIQALTVYGSTLFAGTYGGGVFRSIDNGNTWDAIGLSNYVIRTFTQKGLSLFTGTSNEGIWKAELSTLDVPSDISEINSQLVCYPNPAANILTIDCTSLHNNDETSVKYVVTSMLGDVISTYEHQEGRFSIPLINIAAGVYSLTAQQGLKQYRTMFTVVK